MYRAFIYLNSGLLYILAVTACTISTGDIDRRDEGDATPAIIASSDDSPATPDPTDTVRQASAVSSLLGHAVATDASRYAR